MIRMFFGPDALDFLRSDGKTKKLENWVCGRSDNDLHNLCQESQKIVKMILFGYKL